MMPQKPIGAAVPGIVVLDDTDSPGRGESIEYALLEDLPSVARIASLAALELHVT
jgi:hypothetical protein